ACIFRHVPVADLDAADCATMLRRVGRIIMRVVAGLILCALGAAAASAMPPADDLLGNTTALRDSPSIAGRPDADTGVATLPAADQSVGRPELIAIMDKVEATQRMPAGSAPIAAYERYYAWADAQK